jgi:hypothetical protein
MINRIVDTVMKTRSEYGNIRIEIPNHTIDRDVMIQVNKLKMLASRVVNGGMPTAGSFESNALSQLQISEITPGLFDRTGDNNMLRESTEIQLVAKDGIGNDITHLVVFNQNKSMMLTMPYPDYDQNGIVDGTSIPENSLRIWYRDTDGWRISDLGFVTNIIDTDKNTVTIPINSFGNYAIMSAGTEPTIENMVVYPNPFEDQTMISFNIGSQGNAKAEIFTLSGRRIKSFNKDVGINNLGYVEFLYDGDDDTNNPVSNGTYLYKVTTKFGDKTHTKTGKLTKMK